jgi:hypothetical protein
LLTAATEYVVAIALDKLTADAKPRAALRALAMSIFDTVDDHPWVYQQLINPPWSTATLRLFEKIGRELQTLGVAENLEFTAASALLHYVLGAAGQNVANTSSVPEGADRTTFLSVTADEWNKLDPAQFAFVRHLAEQLPYHDDRDQFLAGVNLVLAGISAEPGGEA